MDEPLHKLEQSELLTSAPVPDQAAETLFLAAIRGRQGARCLVCGTVVRKLGRRYREITVVKRWEDGPQGPEVVYGIACSELCRARFLHSEMTRD
jgi:hypothetical protein